ncbi:MAG: hypothetical protein K8S98_05125 [Planctomycetes bacterium]|nr:hypothetical protein [Planctomycetota bacterium]
MGKHQAHGKPQRDLPDDGPVGNRPANNARISTPGSVVEGLQHGGVNAGDFLGLNDDMASSTPMQAAPIPTAEPAGASWLFQQPEPEPVVLIGDEDVADEPTSEPVAEIEYQEPEPPVRKSVRKLKPAMLVGGAAVVVGMIGFAAWSALSASHSNKDADHAPKVVDASALPPATKFALPQPSAASKYPGRRSIAGDGSEPQPVADVSVASAWELPAPEPDPVQVEPSFEPTSAPSDATVAEVPSDETLSTDTPSPTQWIDTPVDQSFAPELEPAAADQPVLEEEDSAEEVPVIDTGSASLPHASAPSSDGFVVETVHASQQVSAPVVADDEVVATSPSRPLVIVGAPLPEASAASTAIAEHVESPSTTSPIEVVAETNPAAAVKPSPEHVVELAPAPAVDAKTEPEPAHVKPPLIIVLPSPLKHATPNDVPAMPSAQPSSTEAVHDVVASNVEPSHASVEHDVVANSVETPAPAPSDKPVASKPEAAPATPPSTQPAAPIVVDTAKPAGDGTPKVEPVVVKATDVPASSVEGSVVITPTTPVVAPKVEKTTDAGGLRKASAVDMASIWTDTAIPFDAIAGDKRILTPSVGRVRVLLVEKQVFEGLLYSVGQNQVTIQTDLGRIGITGERIQKMERIEVAKADPAKDAADTVRIKTPGGIVVGKILSTDGGQTIVMTSDGARVTFASKDIQIQSGSKVGIKP